MLSKLFVYLLIVSYTSHNNIANNTGLSLMKRRGERRRGIFESHSFYIMEKICGIYKITSPTGKIYIGQSVDIKRRWQYHKSFTKTNLDSILYRSFAKYSVDEHKFEILEECKKEDLNERERYYIELYDTFETEHGMNLTKGGDSKVVFSESTLRKMSIAKKGKSSSRENFHHTEETKKILSEKSKGNKNWLGKHRSEETKEKLRKINTGKKLSDETKKILSEKLKGNKYALGCKPTKEAIKKKIISKTGKKCGSNHTSKYYGVCYDKSQRSWKSVIVINKKQIHIKRSHNEIEVANAYDEFVTKNIDFYVPLNREKFEVNDYHNNRPVQLNLF